MCKVCVLIRKNEMYLERQRQLCELKRTLTVLQHIKDALNIPDEEPSEDIDTELPG